jgi:hypothetical protein
MEADLLRNRLLVNQLPTIALVCSSRCGDAIELFGKYGSFDLPPLPWGTLPFAASEQLRPQTPRRLQIPPQTRWPARHHRTFARPKPNTTLQGTRQITSFRLSCRMTADVQ